MIDWTVLLHLAVTWALAGIIWFVQLVHYPLFALVDRKQFPDFEAKHSSLTGIVVAPLMICEAVGGIFLAVEPTHMLQQSVTGLGLALIVVIWISTFAVQVPCHRILGAGFDAEAHQRLVRTNWIRTVAWSARAILLSAAIIF